MVHFTKQDKIALDLNGNLFNVTHIVMFVVVHCLIIKLHASNLHTYFVLICVVNNCSHKPRALIIYTCKQKH